MAAVNTHFRRALPLGETVHLEPLIWTCSHTLQGETFSSEPCRSALFVLERAHLCKAPRPHQRSHSALRLQIGFSINAFQCCSCLHSACTSTHAGRRHSLGQRDFQRLQRIVGAYSDIYLPALSVGFTGSLFTHSCICLTDVLM